MKHRYFKRALTQVGQHSPVAVIRALNSVVNYVRTGHWFQMRGMRIETRVPERLQIFDLVASQIAEAPVAYLEFGVYQGETIRYWSRLLRHPSSVLHGFDSFTGLPEDWNFDKPQGYFSVGGAIPVIDDPRVKFHKGWFSETLKDYNLPERPHLFVNIDADLYSSAKTVLDFLAADRFPIGSYIYFDEFCDWANEQRAFDEFIRETKMQFRALCATDSLEHVVFQRVK